MIFILNMKKCKNFKVLDEPDDTEDSELSCGKERSTRAGDQTELRRQLKC